jgi:hypothetical protein
MLFQVLFWTCSISESCVKMTNMRQVEGRESVDTLVLVQSESRLLDHDIGGVYGNVALTAKRSFNSIMPFCLPDSLLKLYW